jgi:hypothetical protein
MNPPLSKKWADWTDDDPWDPPSEYIDKNGIKVSYVPPHLRKKSLPADKNKADNNHK